MRRSSERPDVHPYLLGDSWRGTLSREEAQMYREVKDQPGFNEDKFRETYSLAKEFSGVVRHFNGTMVEWGQKLSSVDMSYLTEKTKNSMLDGLGKVVQHKEATTDQTANYSEFKQSLMGFIQGRPDAQSRIKKSSESYLTKAADRKQKAFRAVDQTLNLRPGADVQMVECVEKLSTLTREEVWPHRAALRRHFDHLIKDRPAADDKTELGQKARHVLVGTREFLDMGILDNSLLSSLSGPAQEWKQKAQNGASGPSASAPRANKNHSF